MTNILLDEKEWLIDYTYIYSEEDGDLRLAFPEELVSEMWDFDLRYGNQKVTKKYRYLCTSCKHKFLRSGGILICPKCGAKNEIEKDEKRGFIVHERVIGPIGTKYDYDNVRRHVRQEFLLNNI